MALVTGFLKQASFSTTYMWCTVLAAVTASIVFYVFMDPCQTAASEELGIVGVVLMCELFRRAIHVPKSSAQSVELPSKAKAVEDDDSLILDTASTADDVSTLGELSSTCSSTADTDSESESTKMDSLEWHKFAVRMASSAGSSFDSEEKEIAEDAAKWQKIGERAARAVSRSLQDEEVDVSAWQSIGVRMMGCISGTSTKSRTSFCNESSDDEAFDVAPLDSKDWCSVSGRLSELLTNICNDPINY